MPVWAYTLAAHIPQDGRFALSLYDARVESIDSVAAADVWLDRLRSLGYGGVTLGIKIPMLLPQFGPDADAYVRYYTTVAEHARDRHLTVGSLTVDRSSALDRPEA